MKKLLLLLPFLFSCSLYLNTEFPYFDNEADNYIYVVKDISYKLNPIDWPYPEEVIYQGYADCNGKAALLAALFERNLGYDVKLWTCFRKDDLKGHMIVEANNIFYEPTSIFIYTDPEEYYYMGKWMSLESYIEIADMMHLR